MKKIILLCFIILAINIFAYEPPAGGEDINDYVSPEILGGNKSMTETGGPMYTVINPAAAGYKQRVITDLSYIGLAGFGDEDGYKGNVFNVGASLPSKAGVLSFSGHYLKSSFDSIDIGEIYSIKTAFSKDVFSDLLVGASVDFSYGDNDDTDWAATADFGFIHKLGTFGPLNNFRWAIVLNDLGKSLDNVDGASSYPSPFTPGIGAGFTLAEKGETSIDITNDVYVPSFQNIRYVLGAELNINKSFKINTSFNYDFKERFDQEGPRRSLLPGIGISFNIQTDIKKDIGFIKEKGWNRNDVSITTAAAPMQNDIWAMGLGLNASLGLRDKEGPEIAIEYPEKQYISPNNDGIKDTLIFPVTIKDQRYIKGYAFKILNENNNVIDEIRNKELRPENEGFRDFMDKLMSVKEGIIIPEKFRWDGITQDGEVITDGNYSFYVESWDDNENISRSEIYDFVLDLTAPEIVMPEVNDEDKIFSPNDDGNKETIRIANNTSREVLWTAIIKDVAGNSIRTESWENTELSEFIWDGKNDSGQIVPDGVYHYELTSTDLAGNTSLSEFNNIIINTEATPITVKIDKSHFSPNGDGRKDNVDFSFDIPVKKGIQAWTLLIKDKNSEVLRTISGNDTVPEIITFDGNNDNNKIIDEAEYYGELNVIYVNGNNPVEKSPVFVMDITDPDAKIKNDFNVFSPNNDGKKDSVSFYHEASSETVWKGIIENEKSEIIKEYIWPEKPDDTVKWDGHSEDGQIAEDGVYKYYITAEDTAGNIGKSNILTFKINTEETPVFLSAEGKAFSPNGDGAKDEINLTPVLKIKTGIVSYKLNIFNEKDAVVKTYEGRTIPEKLVWKGFSDNNQKLEDGLYYGLLTVSYENGNQPAAKSKGFYVDTVAPSAEISAEYNLFSPNKDGEKDFVPIKQKTDTENIWEGFVYNDKKEQLRKFIWKNEAQDFAWDGKSESGNPVADGFYTYVLKSTDEAGNYFETEIKGIEVDNRLTRVFVTKSNTGLSPNEDGVFDEISFNTVVNMTQKISSWSLDIVDGKGNISRSIKGKDLPSKIVWNGKDKDNKIVEGKYNAVFTVIYEKGDKPKAESGSFAVDISGPRIDMNMSPVPFSPDNDGVEDELNMKISLNDLSDIKAWEMLISDPKDVLFREFKGKGMPADNIIWNGLSMDGELAMAAEDYPYYIIAEDSLGNKAVNKGKIPIDVLVIRDGDRLKIRISSITFEPNSPELEKDKDLLEKNIYVIKRIAQILKKYKDYSIRIEGHAVSLMWQDKAAAEKEENAVLKPLALKRAQTVRNALIDLGVDKSRMTTAGLGGTEPLVPHSDTENRWKNRRVEFILIK